ncbi:MAG: MFS transporter, partial [Clostridiales bacterium]
WILYDWANSVYATVIMSTLFPIYFATIAADASGQAGDVIWGYGTSAATLMVAVLAPLLGSVADFRGMKKKLLLCCILVGTSFTLTMAIFDQWQWMLAGYIVSYMGFSLANLFYDSLLTDITTPERMHMISAKGYAFGYISSGLVPIAVVLIMSFSAHSIESAGYTAVKAAVVITSLWWGLFAIPMLINCRQTYFMEPPAEGILRASFHNLAKTAKEIALNKPIFLYMLAYFCYIDGVGTVIRMATSYGVTIGLDARKMLLSLIITQVVAIPCSLLFARLADKIGIRRILLAGCGIYVLICVIGFEMGFSLENAAIAANVAQVSGGEAAYNAIYVPALARSQTLFWILAVLVGTSQGGMQALSRSQFGKIIPRERSNEYYGFFDIFGKFATVIGPLLYSFSASVTNRSSVGIISLTLLFLLGIILLLLTPKEAFASGEGHPLSDTAGEKH